MTMGVSGSPAASAERLTGQISDLSGREINELPTYHTLQAHFSIIIIKTTKEQQTSPAAPPGEW